jgi:hypothetical protein
MLASIRDFWRATAEKRRRGRAELRLQVELEKAARKAAHQKAVEDFVSSAPSRSHTDSFGWLGTLIMAGIIFLGWLWWSPKAWYEIRYSVPAEHVFIDPEPHDCEFMKAPIGNKYCHYEKVVVTSPEGSANPTDVYVTWNKVEE